MNATELSLRHHLTASKIASLVLTAAAFGIVGSTSAQAASETWVPTATGTYFWTATSVWNGGAAPGADGTTTNTDTATFGNAAAAQTVTVDSTRNLQNITFNLSSGTAALYTFATGPLVLTAGGSITLSGTSSNTTGIASFTDPITLEGSYSFTNNGTGAAGTADDDIITSAAGTMTGAASIGSYSLTLGGSNNSNNEFSGVIAQGTGNTMSLVKSGIGTWILNATNSFTGTTTIDGGILGITSLANAGTTSAIGSGTNGATPAVDIIINGGTLQFDSTSTTSGSTNRLVKVGNGDTLASGVTADTATFDNEDPYGSIPNGTGTAAGLMNFTNTGAVTWGDTAAHTLTFTGINQGNNTFALAIGDENPSNITSVIKSGIGTWVLSGANSYSGSTTINGGVLRDSTGTALPTNSLLVLSGGTFETSAGTFTRTLGTAAGNIEFTGGASGLSANGGAVNATINNAGAPLQFGSSTFSPSTLILNAPTANNALTLNDSLDFNGATQTIATYANTATLDGSIINSAAGTTAGLVKAGLGTLVLNGTSSSTYNGTTIVNTGVLMANTAASLGTGNATVWDGAELRLANSAALGNGATVTLNNAILGETYNATQANLAAILTATSSGILAIDGTQSNALNMAALGNGALYLGSSSAGTYSAATLGITSGGTELDSGGAPNQIATFGGYYRLGGGGSTLTIIGQNVLTNQPASLLLSNYTGTTPSQSLLTSNNYNSVIIGDGSNANQLDGNGRAIINTVDLQNSQNYLGTTTINAGSVLKLDYSNTGSSMFTTSTSGVTSAGNIISQYSPIVMNSGTLSMIAGAGTTDTQTLGGVTSNTGFNTISTTGSTTTGTHGTLNLGALATNNGAMTVFSETGSNTSITTTTGPDSSGATLGAPYLYNNNGTYTWAGEGAVSTSGTYTIGAYTGDTTALPTSGASATNNYIMSASTQTIASETINLLRVTTASGLTIGKTTAATLTLNGLLYTGSGNLTFGQGVVNSTLTSNSGNLYIYNEGTGTIVIPQLAAGDSLITGTENVTFGGTGAFSGSFEAGTPLAYTGVTYLDGVTFNYGDNSNPFAGTMAVGSATPGTGQIVINAGTTLNSAGNSSTTTANNPLILNGNFTLGREDNTNLNFNGGATLMNNITITVNTQSIVGGWTLLGTVGDGGFGYGLTVGANSPAIATEQNTPLNMSDTTTFTGPITLLGDGITIAKVSAINRFNVLQLAANTTAFFGAGGVAAPYLLAGLQDAGAPSSTEVITDNDGLNNGSGTYLAIQLMGNGNYSFGGVISNFSPTDSEGTTNLVMDGAGGTQTLTGANTFNDGVAVNAGTLIVDASKGGSLNSTNALTLGGGTFEFIGANTGSGTTQSFASTTINGTGQSKIVAAGSGTTTLNLGGLAAGTVGSVVDIAPANANASITTTTGLTNGVYGLGTVVYTNPTTGVTTWATANTSGSSPFTIAAYSGDSTALPTSGISATGNYNLTGSLTETAATVNPYLLRISNSSTGTLTLGSSTVLELSGDGLLYNGTANYTITGGFISNNNNGILALTIDNYAGAGGSLTIASNIGTVSGKGDSLVLAGTGTTFLTGTNTYTGATYFDGGTTNFNSLANFQNTSGYTFAGGTLQYATGNTADFTKTAVGGTAVINVAIAGGTVDTNGNAVTWSKAFGNSGTTGGGLNFTDSYNAANPTAPTGSLTIDNNITYSGLTTISSGGVVNLVGNNVGGGTVVGNGGTLEGGTTQATSMAQTTGSSDAGKLTLLAGGVIAPGSPGIGTLVNNGSNGGIQAAGIGGSSGGANKGDQNANVGNNVLEASQLQWYAGGTLTFYLDSTTTASSAAAPAASTVLNLGIGALAKMGGNGQYILNFANTGGYNVNGSPNVYDLINFGLPTLANNFNANGNTDFTVDDFTIENLNGIGVLSFYDNTSANGGAGQEELILTVIPEPSTWAMLIGGLATLIFWTRRKRASATRSFARK